MSRASLFLATLIISACSPANHSIHPETPPATPVAIVRSTAAMPVPAIKVKKYRPAPPIRHLSQQENSPLSYRHTASNGVVISLVIYDDRSHQLRVADQPKGLGTRWQDAKAAATHYGGLAAINGGFFSPEGKPLGILIENGTQRGSLNPSSLGAGLYISSAKKSAIVRREKYFRSKAVMSTTHLLQTGPMLAENNQTISGLSKTNSRPRSFIAWDGNHHWAIGHAESCTLDALSRALAGKAPCGFKIKTAVNLDGGRSSDLWVAPSVSGAGDTGKVHRSFFNKLVRNYLVLIARE